MPRWYEVTVYRVHNGTGRSADTRAFVYADDVIGVLNRYKRMPGVRRNFKGCNFPDVSPLPEEECLRLERSIVEEGRVALHEARRTWYYPKIE